jgi:hypothetical protein
MLNFLVYSSDDQMAFSRALNNAFTPEAKVTYKKIVELYDPKIVISSSWADNFSEYHFRFMFSKLNMKLNLAEEYMTKRELDNGNTRYTQIKDYLERHPHINRFFILDDTGSGESLLTTDLEPYTIFCDRPDEKGLCEKHLEQIKTILEK